MHAEGVDLLGTDVPADSGENALMSKEDRLLPTVLFRRVFISYADRFIVLDPW
jgi:hypothetical protein